VYFYVIWFCFYGMLTNRLAGKTIYSCDIFCVEGFSLIKYQIEELFAAVVYCMYPQAHNIVNFLRLISLFVTATYLSKAQYSLFVLKVPLNPNQLYSTDGASRAQSFVKVVVARAALALQSCRRC